jgi:ATP-dependent Clp protease ATP-binding subunit ClpC
VVLAQEEARVFGHHEIGTEHLLLGLIHEGQGVAAKALTRLGVEETRVRVEVEKRLGRRDDTPPQQIPFTRAAKKALEMALREALQLGHNYIGTEHILLGLLAESDGMAVQVLTDMGLGLDTVRATTLEVLGGIGSGAGGSSTTVGSAVDVGAAAGGEAARPLGAAVALCPTCRLPLADRLAVQAVPVTVGEAGAIDQQVLVAYCRSCGCSVGLVAASPPSPATEPPPAT